MSTWMQRGEQALQMKISSVIEPCL